MSQPFSHSVSQSVSQAVSQAASQPVSPSVSFDEKGCATTYIAHARLPRTHTYIRSPVHTTKCRRREMNSFFFKNINRTALIHSLARAFVRLLFNNYFESEWGFVFGNTLRVCDIQHHGLRVPVGFFQHTPDRPDRNRPGPHFMLW